MMRYKLFDIILVSDTEFNILSAADTCDLSESDEWTLKYEKSGFESDNISAEIDSHGRIVIRLRNFAQYIIDYQGRLIIAAAPRVEYIEATIFNIPMAVIAVMKQSFPLHASAVMCGGRVMAFCGEKGVGKSTLIYNLLKHDSCDKNSLSFFTDDALLIKACTSECEAYSCGEYMKLVTEEITPDEKRVSSVLPDTIYKSYVRMSREKDHGKPEKIFFLKRSDRKSFEITPITNEFEKTLNLYNNLIGIDYLPAVCKSVRSTVEKYAKIMHKAEMYKIEMPSDTENYGNALNDFMKEILA